MSDYKVSDYNVNAIQGRSVSSLSDLATFVGKTAIPRKNRSDFWNAYKSATATNLSGNIPKKASDLLGVVLTISARTRRMVAEQVDIELDVFCPDGKRAVQLIMGKYK